MQGAWVVRAGPKASYIEDFLEDGVVAVGGAAMGALSEGMTKDEILALYSATYPTDAAGTASNWASQLARFLNEISVGDAVVTYAPDQRLYFIGRISSEYLFAPKKLEHYPHMRNVEWKSESPRDSLSESTRNTLGAIQTLFRIDAAVLDELNRSARPFGEAAAARPAVVDEELEAATHEPNIESGSHMDADARVEDAIARIDWYEMQELVAGILRAMGYRTKISPKGADHGVDIFASPDGLGLQEPRIFVEVKHRVGTAIDAGSIRSFLGGRKAGDRCIYVSTGGFTKDARYEAERATIPLTLLTLTALRELLLEHYERLDTESRQLVPLRRVYVPLSR